MSFKHMDPWRPGSGEWNLKSAHHLLVRAGFGAARGEAQHLVDLGFQDSMVSMLHRDEHDPRMLAGISTILSTGQIQKLSAWWMSLILGSGAPLRERVTLMWHNHFATSYAKVQDHRMMHDQVQLMRTLGMGDFRELLHAIARDPAMLRWLDGDKNRAGNPNENFAREVMELFALGIGNYTEMDIHEAARAFTGWREHGSSFKLRAVDHDSGLKTLLGKSGAWNTADACDILIASPHCARHIARRLLGEFVHPMPEQEWIDEAAEVLVKHDWHIERTIRVILASRLFFSSQARRSRIAAPVELMAGCARSLGIQARPADFVERCAQMGQKLFHPKSVKGWDGMRSWINAGTWIVRHNSLLELCEQNQLELNAEPRELISAFLPDLSGTDLEARLGQILKEQPQLREKSSQVAALIFTSPEYQLI